MCEIADFKHLRLDESHKAILEGELETWHRCYLPIGKVVLDIGAGNGETAQFYLNHGAEKVICVEPDAKLLRENFGEDPRVVIIPLAVDSIKSDCEGAEKNMVIETHFPVYLDKVSTYPLLPYVNIWKLKTFDKTFDSMRKLQRLRYWRIQAATFVRHIIDVVFR